MPGPEAYCRYVEDRDTKPDAASGRLTASQQMVYEYSGLVRAGQSSIDKLSLEIVSCTYDYNLLTIARIRRGKRPRAGPHVHRGGRLAVDLYDLVGFGRRALVP